VAEVRFSARALRSLRGIERYLGERNPAAAERVIEEIGRACALIGDFPKMGPAIPGNAAAAARHAAVSVSGDLPGHGRGRGGAGGYASREARAHL
jgi:plasmid stabilization system protein ParE